MSQHSLTSLPMDNNSSTYFMHHFPSNVWHQSESKVPSSYDLSKSMIKKIPGPKRPMGENLQLVLLFQAAQIQRLTQNLQVLNNYRREIEKGPMNLKSMEIQIKELTDEIFRKQKEISMLRQKYEAALKNLSEFDISNQQLERKLREKLLEVRQYKQQLYEKDLTVSESQKYVDEKQIYIKKLNDSIFFLSKDREELEQKNDEYLDKLALLSQEMVRLRESNNKMKSNKGSMEGQLQQLKKENFNLKSILEKERLQNEQLHMMSQHLSQQIEQFKRTIEMMRDNQQHTLMERSSQMMSLEQRNEQWYNENNRLKGQLIEMGRGLGEKERAVQEMGGRLQKAIQEAMGYKKECQRLNDILNNQQGEFNLLKQHFRQLQYNLQSEKSYYSQEVTNFELRQREVQEKKQQQVVKRQNEIKQLRRENQHLTSEVGRLAAILQRVEGEKESLNTTLGTNIEDFNKQIQERDSIIREKQHQLTQLQRNIQHLSLSSRQNIQSHSSTIKELTEVIQQLKAHNYTLREDISKVVKEKQSLIGELSNKQISQSSITIRYQTLLRDLENRNGQLQTLRKEKNTQTQTYRKQISQREREIEAITYELKMKHHQIQELKNELNIYQQSLSQKDHLLHQKHNYIQQKQHKFQQIQTQYKQRDKTLLSDIKGLQNKLQDKQRQCFVLKQRISALENQLNLVTHELQRVSMIIREKDQLLIERMDQIHNLSKVQQEVKYQVKSLREVITKKDMELSSKHINDMNNQERLIGEMKERMCSQINELKRLVIRKDEQLVRCNQYITKLNEKVSQLTVQQSVFIKELESAQISNSKSAKQNKQIYSRILQLLRGIKQDTSTGITTISKNIQEYHTVNQNNQYTTKQQYAYIEQQISNGNKITERNIQLQEALKQREMTVTALESQLEMLRGRVENHSQYERLLGELQSISEENQAIKQMIREINHTANGQMEKHNQYTQQQLTYYRMELQDKSVTVNQLNTKLNQIYGEMEDLVKQFQNAEKQLNQYQSVRNIETKHFQLLKNQAVNQAVKETEYKADTLFKSMETQLLNQIAALKQQISSLLKENQTLTSQNQHLQNKFSQVQSLVNAKKQQILKFHQVLMKNNQEYVKKNQLQKFHLQGNIKLLTEENHKLLAKNKVLNEQAHKYLANIRQKQQLIKKIHKQSQQKDQEVKKLKSLKKRVEQLQQQIFVLLQEKNTTSLVDQQQMNAQIKQFKLTISELQSMNANLHMRLQQALNKLNGLSQHLGKLQADESSAVRKLQALVEVQGKYQETLKILQGVQIRKSELEMLLTKKESQNRQLLIQKEFNDKSKSGHNVVLAKYESKLKMVICESQKFSQLIGILQSENLGLKKMNSSMVLQLKKAQLAQQKIHILNREIERLSIEKIDLDQELTTYKLQISQESLAERKIQEQLCVMVMMFAEIQALRARLKNKEEEIEQTRRSHSKSVGKGKGYH